MRTDELLALAQFAPRDTLTGYIGHTLTPEQFFAAHPHNKAAFFPSELMPGYFVFAATPENTHAVMYRDDPRPERTAQPSALCGRCERPRYARGLCSKHYQEARRKGIL